MSNTKICNSCQRELDIRNFGVSGKVMNRRCDACLDAIRIERDKRRAENPKDKTKAEAEMAAAKAQSANGLWVLPRYLTTGGMTSSELTLLGFKLAGPEFGSKSTIEYYPPDGWRWVRSAVTKNNILFDQHGQMRFKWPISLYPERLEPYPAVKMQVDTASTILGIDLLSSRGVPYMGMVTVAGKVVFRTAITYIKIANSLDGYETPNSRKNRLAALHDLRLKCSNYIAKKYPDANDPFAYWTKPPEATPKAK